MRKRLSRVSGQDWKQRSGLICSRLVAAAAFRESRSVLVFLSMSHEVDTAPIIAEAQAAGKLVAVPSIDGDRLAFRMLAGDPEALPLDDYGIRVPRVEWPVFDPAASRTRTLVVVPGLAFDRNGNRLGRGKGFYDRFLRDARVAAGENLVAVAICLSEQITELVPTGPDDQRVDAIVTERELVTIPRRSSA